MTETENATKVKHRWLTAILLVISLFIALKIIDRVLIVVVSSYAPSFAQYTAYISETTNALIGMIGAYVVYKVLCSIVDASQRKSPNDAGSRVVKTVLRVLFYIAAIAIALISFGPSLGITIEQALAGGAIGGVVLGFAVQTVASSVLSGIFLSASRTLKRGEVIIMHSSLWGGDLICRVARVNMLFTEVVTQNNTVVRIPNTTLLTSTVFTRIKDGEMHNYTFQLGMNADVRATELEDGAKRMLKERFTRLKVSVPEIFLTAKNPGNNVFTVILRFANFEEVNSLVSAVNETFDDAYWDIKNKSQAQPPSLPKTTGKKK